MGWSELDFKPVVPTDAKTEETEALRRALEQVVGNKLVRGALRRVADRPSFNHGLPFETVAFHEGRRSLALELLKSGGVRDE